MLILLPPSEGKAAPRRGTTYDAASLSFPGLTGPREQVLDALVALGEGDPATAARVLGLGPSQGDLVRLDARVRVSPTARAERVYTGVLYDALGLPSLPGAARRRAAHRLVTTSSLFGLVRPADRIPAYRLSGDTALPGLGAVAAHWREHLGPELTAALGAGLLIDLRSAMYAAFWRPPADLAPQVATVRVLHEVSGRRQVVSHFNKATKGHLVAGLLSDGRRPRTPGQLADVWGDLGWHVEVDEPSARGTRLDVVVRGG